jgi:hypothetical protein
MKPIPMDIPQTRKVAKHFNIGRPIHCACPYVDSIRERYWRQRLYHLIKERPTARALMFVGAFHLKSFLPKPMTFLDLLTRAGYSVTSANLYDGEIWNHHNWNIRVQVLRCDWGLPAGQLLWTQEILERPT